MTTNNCLKNNLTPSDTSELSVRRLVNRGVVLLKIQNPLKGQFPGTGNETRHENGALRLAYAERSGVAQSKRLSLSYYKWKAITLIGKLKADWKHVWQKPGKLIRRAVRACV